MLLLCIRIELDFTCDYNDNLYHSYVDVFLFNGYFVFSIISGFKSSRLFDLCTTLCTPNILLNRTNSAVGYN